MNDFDFHSIFSTKTVVISTFIIIAISLIISFIIKPSEYEKTRFHVFMSILASVAVVLIGLSLGISSLALETQQEANRVTVTEQAIATLVVKPYDLIVKSTNMREKFVKSIFFNNLALYNLPSKDEKETRLSIIEEQNVCIILLQSWEDYLTLRHLIITDDNVWIIVFLQWAQSPYLKKYYFMYKHLYTPEAIKLGELLFEYAARLPIPTPDPQAYVTLVSEMLKDPRLIKVFKDSSQKK